MDLTNMKRYSIYMDYPPVPFARPLQLGRVHRVQVMCRCEVTNGCLVLHRAPAMPVMRT